jgi:hypothetical protein
VQCPASRCGLLAGCPGSTSGHTGAPRGAPGSRVNPGGYVVRTGTRGVHRGTPGYPGGTPGASKEYHWLSFCTQGYSGLYFGVSRGPAGAPRGGGPAVSRPAVRKLVFHTAGRDHVLARGTPGYRGTPRYPGVIRDTSGCTGKPGGTFVSRGCTPGYLGLPRDTSLGISTPFDILGAPIRFALWHEMPAFSTSLWCTGGAIYDACGSDFSGQANPTHLEGSGPATRSVACCVTSLRFCCRVQVSRCIE